MATTPEDRDFQARLQRLEGLLQEVERGADPAARERTREIVQTLLDLHGSGLKRIVAEVAAAGAVGRSILDRLAQDELVSSLLSLYDLHPIDLEARVRQALDRVRPALHSHGGDVELLDVTDGRARLRLHGSCHDCPSSGATMQQTIEQAIYAGAPEVSAI